MALSSNTIVASGLSATIAVTFDYIDKSHVHVLINTVEVDDDDLTWDNDSLVRLPTAPLAGSVVKVYRDTPKEDLSVVFETTGIFEGDKINLAHTQLLFIAQEAYDRGYLTVAELDAAIAYVNQTAQAAQASADTAQSKLTAAQAAVTAAQAAQLAAENARDSAVAVSGVDLSLYLTKAGNLSGIANAATARANIGAAAAADILSTLVRYDAAQSLNDTQKGQARTNIGAVGPTYTGDVAITGTFKVTVNGNSDQSKIELKGDGTRYMTYGVGGDFYSFNGAHVYSAAGRLLGTSDASSIVSGVRLTAIADSTGLAPYAGAVLTGLTYSLVQNLQQLANDGNTYNYVNALNTIAVRYKYLQYNIGGTWYTAAYA